MLDPSSRPEGDPVDTVNQCIINIIQYTGNVLIS